MTLDRALLENVEATTRQVAKLVATYRRQLDDEGLPPDEAWAMARRLEERLLGPVFETAERELSPAPWADLEALFVAVINLQLVLGQAPDAVSAVRYMRQAGVKVRTLTFEEADRLSSRASIPAADVWYAFEGTPLG